MNALTVWQPWASLIAIGAKPFEFRAWAAPRAVRGTRIAIHAGARAMKKAEISDLIVRLRLPKEAWKTGLKRSIALPFLERIYLEPDIVPLSAVVCTAMLGEPKRSWEVAETFGHTVNDSDRDEHSNWAWPVTDIEQLIPPEPARGAQGFWTWTSATLPLHANETRTS